MVGGFLFLVCFAEDSVRCSMVGGNFSSLGSIWTVQINPLKNNTWRDSVHCPSTTCDVVTFLSREIHGI